MNSNCSISWARRGRAALFYAGLLPLFYLAPRMRATPFLAHHFRQAAAIYALLLAVTALQIAAVPLLSYLLVFHREFYEGLGFDGYVLGALRKLYLAWLVFWAFGLGMAILGGMRRMPLVHGLSGKHWITSGTCAILLTLYGAAVLLLPAAAYASSLVPPDRHDGVVYMIYEDNGLFPRWIFALGFYPMARAARDIYGPDAPVLQRISRETIGHAVARGKLVFVGSHGTGKGLLLEDGWLRPKDFAPAPKNDGLELVYLTGCDSGEQRAAWEAVFAPAEVVTFERLSAVIEHIWWLWFEGPAAVRALEREET